MVLTGIVVFLSFTLFAIHGTQVREQRGRDLERARTSQDSTHVVSEPRLEEYLEALGRSIVSLDIVTILLGGTLGYWLAGRTLRPIRDAVLAEQRFFNNAAHDLRTPLAVMRTEAEVTLRDPQMDLGAAKATLQSSLEEIARMAVLVEEMMALGTPDSPGPSPGAFETVDLTDLVQTSAERMKVRASALGITLVVESGAPILVEVAPGALERAVINVLENALKFTPPAEP